MPSAAPGVSVSSRLRASSSCEQADVLDGDHRLVGERLQQLDLRVGEGLGLAASDGDRADRRRSSRSIGMARDAPIPDRLGASACAGHSRRSTRTSATYDDGSAVDQARPARTPGRPREKAADRPRTRPATCCRWPTSVEHPPSNRQHEAESRIAQPRGARRRWRRTPAADRSASCEMTRRISLVAVCCSSDSVRSRLRASSSLNSRTFSMAITAWSAKVLRSSTCRSVKGRPRSAGRRWRRSGGRPRSIGTPSIVR